MKETIDLTSDSPILENLKFKPYRNVLVRRAIRFSPNANEPQSKQVQTPWGSLLTVKNGDMLVSEVDKPEDQWPVDAKIFEETYIVVGDGLCIKRAITLLVPLIEVANGEANQMVTVHTLEGVETVRAGDFYLAKGVRGEIWPYPNEKVETKMRPAE